LGFYSQLFEYIFLIEKSREKNDGIHKDFVAFIVKPTKVNYVSLHEYKEEIHVLENGVWSSQRVNH
jgi:hypothetical protein